MKKIKELILAQATNDNLLAEFNTAKTAASADLVSVLSPSTTIETARKKILDARLTIDLMDVKIRTVNQEWQKTDEELEHRLSLAVTKWNVALQVQREHSQDQICTASLPNFNGDEAACRSWWQAGRMNEQPALFKFAQAYYDISVLLQFHRKETKDRAAHFLKHVAIHAEGCGLESFHKLEISSD